VGHERLTAVGGKLTVTFGKFGWLFSAGRGHSDGRPCLLGRARPPQASAPRPVGRGRLFGTVASGYTVPVILTREISLASTWEYFYGIVHSAFGKMVSLAYA